MIELNRSTLEFRLQQVRNSWSDGQRRQRRLEGRRRRHWFITQFLTDPTCALSQNRVARTVMMCG